MGLTDYISSMIYKNGPICFRDFMELCLYDSYEGYYTMQCKGIGTEGDFYTSATLSPVFGAIVGKQLEEMWELMGRNPFSIVEFGAGTGQLCQAILAYLRGNLRMYEKLRYCIIEKSAQMRDKAINRLPPEVEWFDSISEISHLQGCVLSNELVDNFAVHRVVKRAELMEVYVDFQNGYAEQLQPAGPELKSYLSEMNINLSMGFVTEINLDALLWIAEVASVLKTGYVMTIDYGFQNADMYKEIRNQGTLLCYHNHSVNNSFYEHIGQQDMTAYVNFSALSHWGAKNGLVETGFTNQRNFLTSLGFRDQLLKMLSAETDIALAAQKAAILTHTLIMDMGSKYKVLIQQKGVKFNKLSGLKIPIH